jgi:hypothetical protein
MNPLHRGLPVLLAGLALGLGGTEAEAQGGPALGPVRVITLSAASVSSLSVTITSGSSQTIPSVTDNAVNLFPAPVAITTKWDLNPGQTNSVTLVGYFTNPAQALAGSGVQIPSSRMLGRMTTGSPTTFTAFTQNGVAGIGVAGGSLKLFAVNISGPTKKITRTDNLDLELDLVGFPDLPVGSYTGTLNIRAVAQ